MKKSIFLATLVLFSFILTACMSTFDQRGEVEPGEAIATIVTNKGTIKIRLFVTETPETVKNFAELANKGFYNGLTFHRVIPDFMIQGGDPKGDGTGGETYKGPDSSLKDEFSKNLTHIRGAVSMANRGPNTGTSQFFIVQAKEGTPWLDGKHAVFGQVIEGISTVDAIAKVSADPQNMPLEKVVMEKVEVVYQKGK